MVIFILLTIVISYAETGKISSENGGKVNIRKEPDGKARIVTSIKNGESIEILDHSNGWYHVRFKGKEGYIKEEFVKLLSDAVGKDIYSNGGTLYLRERADDQSAIVGMINSQQSMKIEQIDEEWTLVSANNTRGYVKTGEIDNLNDSPVQAATQIWREGVLEKEIKLYRDADTDSEIVSTWPKGTGVLVSSYNKKWCFVQIADENIVGFTLSSSVKLASLPKVTDKVNDAEYKVTASGARKIAEKALKQYSGFKTSSFTCEQETMYSCDGIQGPLYRFVYKNKSGQVIYAAYVHCVTGELLYKGDYSSFQYDQDIADLRTAAPTTAPRTGYVKIKGDVVWDPDVVTSTPIPGNDIGESSARSIADRYLRAHYPRFSEMTFERVQVQHITDDPLIEGGFIAPYYQFAYFMEDYQLMYCVEINAYSGEIMTCSGPGEGAG